MSPTGCDGTSASVVVGFSTDFWKTGLWRGIEVEDTKFSSMEDFQTDFVEAVSGAMDPNALLTMAWKWQRGDVARNTGGDLEAALSRATAKSFVMPIDEDMFFPPSDCAAEQPLVPGSELQVLHTVAGHLGLFGFEPSYPEEVDVHPVGAAGHGCVSAAASGHKCVTNAAPDDVLVPTGMLDERTAGSRMCVGLTTRSGT